jgi:uncharacterized protein YceK
MRLPWHIYSAVLLASAICCGCSSIWYHSYGKEEAGVYLGTRDDAHLLGHPGEISVPEPFGYPMCLIDLPFSAVTDTLLLPWDMTRSRTNTPSSSDQADK